MKTVVEIRLCFEFDGDRADDKIEDAAVWLANYLKDYHIPDLVCATSHYSPIGEYDKLSTTSTVYLK
jgi:hypothetical protein